MSIYYFKLIKVSIANNKYKEELEPEMGLSREYLDADHVCSYIILPP